MSFFNSTRQLCFFMSGFDLHHQMMQSSIGVGVIGGFSRSKDLLCLKRRFWTALAKLPARMVTESCLVIFFWIHFFQFFIRFGKQRRHYEMTFTRFKHPGLSRFKGVTPDFRPNFENPQLLNRWRQTSSVFVIETLEAESIR